MSQISFKIPDSEIIFLRWFADKSSQPVSSIYRNATLDSFREWKISLLLSEYQKGSLGFKSMCKLGNLTFNQGVLLLEQNNIEPPISKLIDEYSSAVRDKLVKEGIFKKKTIGERKSRKFQPINE